jgi:DNA-binding NtrC family response regulator
MLPAKQRVISDGFDAAQMGLIGRSDAFRAVVEQLAKVRMSEAPVMLCGETGTGKELFARALHHSGPRRRFPFIPLNCAALPDQLVENELFGHEKGAYTGAVDRRTGLLVEASGGTLFLDEVDSLSPHAQAALLRFLQDATYRPLGGGQTHTADTRIVAATNIDLAAAVAEQRFRSDLFYRLNVIALRIPPLRARGEDVVLIACHILAALARRYGCQPKRLTQAALAALLRDTWPGNVRELENRLHRAQVMVEGDCIDAEDVADAPGFGEPCGTAESDETFAKARGRAIVLFERSYLTRLLTRTRGNVSEASRCAGKERRAFRRLLDKHGIDRRNFMTP